MAALTANPKTLYSGQTGSGLGGTLFQDRRQFYVDPFTYSELWTSVTPFISNLVSSGNKKTLLDPNFKLFEHRNPWAKMEAVIKYTDNSTGTSAIASTANNATATLQFSDIVGMSGQGVEGAGAVATSVDDSWVGQMFEVWDSTKTTRRGNVYVSGRAAGVFTVTNIWGAAITNITAGDIIVNIGSVHGEGGVAPEAWADELRVVYGQTGIIKTSVEVTGTLYQASLRGANKELERLRKQKMELHKKKEELFLLRGSMTALSNLGSDSAEAFSDGYALDQDSKVVRSTLGLITGIERYGRGSAGTKGTFGTGIGTTSAAEYQNLFDMTAGMTYNQFVDLMEKLMQYLPENGVVDFYCGPTALSYWSKIDKSSGALKTGFPIRLSDMKTDKLGFFFKYLETPFGLARLIYTPSLKREYRNYMVKVTPENLFLAEYRPLSYTTDVKKDNAYDGVKDQIMSDIGLGMTLIESHSVVKMPYV